MVSCSIKQMDWSALSICFSKICVNANFGESIGFIFIFWVSGPLGIFESDYVVDSTWWIIFCENNEAYHLIKDFSIARIPQCSFLFCSFIGTIEKVSWEYIHFLHHIPKALKKCRDMFLRRKYILDSYKSRWVTNVLVFYQIYS